MPCSVRAQHEILDGLRRLLAEAELVVQILHVDERHMVPLALAQRFQRRERAEKIRMGDDDVVGVVGRRAPARWRVRLNAVGRFDRRAGKRQQRARAAALRHRADAKPAALRSNGSEELSWCARICDVHQPDVASREAVDRHGLVCLRGESQHVGFGRVCVAVRQTNVIHQGDVHVATARDQRDRVRALD